MDTYLFDDIGSVWHAIFGALLVLLSSHSHRIIAAILFVIFLVYEVNEPENPTSTVGDVVEALSGIAVALLLGL